MAKSRVKAKPQKRIPLPEYFAGLEDAGAFWDTPDSADYEEYVSEAGCVAEIKRRTYLVPVDGDLYRMVRTHRSSKRNLAGNPGKHVDSGKSLLKHAQPARELFDSGNPRTIRPARAATDPAVDEIIRIIHDAAATRTRRLVLLTGIPGSGKTLVGLRIVYAHFLDELAVPRTNGKPTAPAIFLSGNGPLVDVLQYELRGAGGGGRSFVRGVKDYVKTYSARPGLIPPEHVLVFDVKKSVPGCTVPILIPILSR
ncbi:MAG: DNA/RNA helicase domain-containing protein [Acidobacteriota bacterium]